MKKNLAIALVLALTLLLCATALAALPTRYSNEELAAAQEAGLQKLYVDYGGAMTYTLEDGVYKGTGTSLPAGTTIYAEVYDQNAEYTEINLYMKTLDDGGNLVYVHYLTCIVKTEDLVATMTDVQLIAGIQTSPIIV